MGLELRVVEVSGAGNGAGSGVRKFRARSLYSAAEGVIVMVVFHNWSRVRGVSLFCGTGGKGNQLSQFVQVVPWMFNQASWRRGFAKVYRPSPSASPGRAISTRFLASRVGAPGFVPAQRGVASGLFIVALQVGFHFFKLLTGILAASFISGAESRLIHGV